VRFRAPLHYINEKAYRRMNKSDVKYRFAIDMASLVVSGFNHFDFKTKKIPIFMSFYLSNIVVLNQIEIQVNLVF
jgi:hypothetical protein